MNGFVIWMMFVLICVGVGSIPIIAELILRKGFKVEFEEDIEEEDDDSIYCWEI